MTINLRRFLFGALFLTTSAAGLHAAGLVNGSFSSPGLAGTGLSAQGLGVGSTFITGWKVVSGYTGAANGSVDYYSSISQDPGGDSVDVGAYFSFVGLEQTFTTQPGQAYQVNFWLATDPYNGPEAQLLASAGGTSVDFVAPPATGDPTSAGWQLESFVFTADSSGSTTLLFQNLLGVSSQIASVAELDTVSVVAIPEPAGVAPIGLALTAIFLRRMKRRRSLSA